MDGAHAPRVLTKAQELSPEDEEFCRFAATLEEERPGACRLCWQRAKFLLALVILFLPRFLVVVIILLCMWATCMLSECCGCACCSRRSSSAMKPHRWIQRKLLGINAYFARLLLFVVGFLWIREAGRPAGGRYRLAAPTVVANHVAMVDIFVILSMLGGGITAVAAEWLQKVPLIGGISKAYHILHVPTSAPPGPGKASQVAPEHPGAGAPSAPSSQPSLTQEPGKQRPCKSAVGIIAEYQAQRQGNPDFMPLMVFPEGTTKNSRCLVKFRTGAFVGGFPVQPVVLRYPHRFRDISWVQLGPLYNLGLILTTWVNWVEVEWLDMYTPSKAEREDPELYAANVQALVASAMELRPEMSSRTVDNARLKRFNRRAGGKAGTKACVESGTAKAAAEEKQPAP